MTKADKTHYSELEAASMLGVSIDQLRSLVRDHIVKDQSSTAAHAVYTTFQASDLVVLRILAAMPRRAEVAHV